MECYVFNDVLNFSETSYLLKTLNSEPQKSIISSVFREGSLINTRSEHYNGHLTEEEIFSRVKHFHNNSIQDINSLFTLSKKYANSREVGKRVLLVRAFMKNKMYTEAANEIARILNLNPNLSIVYFYMGQIHLSLNEFERGIKCFKKAIELNENFADYHFYLGRAYLGMHECKNAIHEFIQAIKLNSYYSDGYYFLGLAYLKNAINKENYNLAKEVKEKSENCFTKAAQIYPNFKNQLFLKGEESLKSGNFEEAYNNFMQALSEEIKGNNDELMLDFYIRYLSVEDNLSIKEIKQYIEKLQSLIKKYTHYADLHHELGIAFTILSKSISNNAIDCFQKALAINPNYAESQKMLNHLRNNQNRIL